VANQDADEVIQGVGRRIAELRLALGLTQDQLGERLDMDTNNLQRIETGRQNLTIRTLVRVANVLDVPVRALFDEPESRKVRIGRPPKNT